MMRLDEIKKLEEQYIVPTYTRGDVVFERGAGVYLYDIGGKEYLDFISGIGTAPLGHSNPVVVEAVATQCRKIINVSNLFYTEPQLELAEKLVKLAGMDGKVFFSNSGAEAVEAAIKLARKYTGKSGIIAAKGGFHGRTLGALSATWKEKFRLPFEPLVPGFKHISYDSLDQLEAAIDENTAAFIVEPIQGEAGIIIPTDGYIKEVRRICQMRGILLIIDEIQSGLGRTGKFFAYQHEHILPDIVVLAKGLANGIPIGATIARSEIASAIQRGEHGSTFGGNSLSAYVACKVVDYILQNKLIGEADRMGNYFIEKLKKLAEQHSSIKEIRGKGLMVAIDVQDGAKDIVQRALQKGLVINNTSEYTLRFLPPLIIKKEEIDKCISILEELID
jgi:predicted acetylornithine/succinylornithine family transaminase